MVVGRLSPTEHLASMRVSARPRLSALFPPAAPWHAPWAAAFFGYLAAAAAGFFLDLRWAGTQRTGWLWAEDGQVFLQSALHDGLWGSLFQPYAGYMHLVPRVTAVLATLLPLDQAARAMAAAAALVRVAIALFVFRAASGHLSLWARGFLAACVVALPVAGMEALDNVANLHWFLTFAAFWAILWHPKRIWECVLGGLIAVAAVLSNPLSLIFLPLIALRFAHASRFRDRLLPLVFGAGGLIQVAVMLGAHRPAHQSYGVIDGIEFFAVRVVLGSLGEYWLTGWSWRHFGYWAVALAALVILVVASFTLRHPGPRRWLAVVALGSSVVGFAAMFVAPAIPPGMEFARLGMQLSRYDVLPDLFVLTALISGLDCARRWVAGVSRLLIIALFVYTIPVDMAASQRLWTRLETTVPPWRAEVAAARLQCSVSKDSDVRVPELPQPWRVTVPCAKLS